MGIPRLRSWPLAPQSTVGHTRLLSRALSPAFSCLQALFRRAELKALVDIHGQTEGISGGYLTQEEIGVIRGALDLSNKTAIMSMTPLEKVGQRLGSRFTGLKLQVHIFHSRFSSLTWSPTFPGSDAALHCLGVQTSRSRNCVCVLRLCRAGVYAQGMTRQQGANHK